MRSSFSLSGVPSCSTLSVGLGEVAGCLLPLLHALLLAGARHLSPPSLHLSPTFPSPHHQSRQLQELFI
ncbi:hypothetical protein E2C01_055156 [Portunus trituberculatus]|uniref:Uncharacterized protein n=1 Tax=Portunus trituberculatus TaxID=210409 RepID=A0A5B7GTY9_PORTR|nr:hypothetical protein [Portunus trituberculatus]